MSNYEMTIYHGESLKTHIENTLTGIDKERFIASQLRDYLNAPNDRKVCCLYGLRRTGKTTMMLQEIERIGDYDKCLLLHCESGSSVMQIRKMIEAYPDSKYIFVDEATKAQNFISTASVLSDNYAAEGTCRNRFIRIRTCKKRRVIRQGAFHSHNVYSFPRAA